MIEGAKGGRQTETDSGGGSISGRTPAYGRYGTGCGYGSRGKQDYCREQPSDQRGSESKIWQIV